MEDTLNNFIHWLAMCAIISLFACMFAVMAKFLIAILNGEKRGGVDWRDLFCTSDGKKIASKKCWSHIAAGVFTFAVLRDSLDGKVDVVLLAVYMLIVGGFEVAMKFLNSWKPQIKEQK